MSQIKSYLSLESVPSIEFKTPVKGLIQNLTTNHSMSLSHTLGSLDNKSLWNRRTFYNSHEVEREPNYQARDLVEERSQEMENNSAVTLSPAITQQDILELVNSVKMIAFLSRRQQEQQARIDCKQAAVKAIKAKIFLLEERAKFLKHEFERKEKNIKSRSLSIQKVKRAASKSLHSELLGMKLEIGQMRRTLSNKKGTIDSRRNSGEKKATLGCPGTERKREKIYVPLFSNRFFANPDPSPPATIQTRPSRHSQYQHPSAFPTSYVNTQQFMQKPPKAANISLSNSRKNSSRNDSKGSIQGPPSAKKHPSDGNQINVLDLIQEKLRMPSHSERLLFSSQSVKAQVKQNPEIASGKLFEMLGPALNRQISGQNFNINVLVEEQKPANLDYFDEVDDLDFEDEMLLNSQKSRKSIKALKQSSKGVGITNKWRKDEEDTEIVEMLKKSIGDTPTKSQQRGQMGIKLVETSIKEDSFSVDLQEKSRERPLSPDRINNNNSSHVQIFVMDNTEEKIKTESLASDKKISAKSIDRNNIVNSDIGISLNEDLTDSMEDFPLSIESKIRPKNYSPRQQMCDRIQEISDETYSRQNTPIQPVAQFRLTTHLQPSVQSRYTATPRETQKEAPMTGSHSSQSSPATPVLSRPPSLLEQEEEEDDDAIINSIKLATNSKYSQDPPSKANRLSQSIELPEETARAVVDDGEAETPNEEDELFGIRLNNMSKISREKVSSNNSNLKDTDSIPSEHGKMAQSELAPASNYQEDSDGMDVIDSELRKSTNSVIVKKGSAIQQTRARRDSNSNTLKASNRGSSVSGKSKEMTSPIEEADEEEEEYPSNIIKKHKRYVTDLPQ